MTPDALVLIFAGVLGSLVGSFANVVIHRLPAGRSVVRPRSACPSCGRVLTPLDLVPVFSWLALRGRCRDCRAPISVRYPLIEAAVAALFVAAAWWVDPFAHPLAAAFLAIWCTVLVIASWIDLDTYQIPDVLTLPTTLLFLGGAFLWAGAPGLPGPADAAWGAAIGAGLLTLVNRIGALVLRRFRDTRERLWPIGFDQANLGALAGTIGGVWTGLVAVVVSVATNLVTRRTVRAPEPLVWGAWIVALAVAPATIGLLPALRGGLAAAGAAALAGALVWWIHDLGRGRPSEGEDGETTPSDDDDATADEPVAMGFGDVKLAALLGVVLGVERLLVALFAAVLIGAVVGVAQRAAGGSRLIPFGPFLALGGILAFVVGRPLIDAYLRLLGF